VRLLGRVDDLESYLGAADLFVFLSRKEGQGYVIVEAMASGLPCVVSPLDGIASEMVDQGESGVILSNPDDADAVAGELSRLLGDAALRRAMGDAARRSAVRRFSIESRVDALAALYREVLDAR
jgi:glycosyltransferase involved in cell wall biosynthesis